jgi:hypothetical protein
MADGNGQINNPKSKFKNQLGWAKVRRMRGSGATRGDEPTKMASLRETTLHGLPSSSVMWAVL